MRHTRHVYLSFLFLLWIIYSKDSRTCARKGRKKKEKGEKETFLGAEWQWKGTSEVYLVTYYWYEGCGNNYHTPQYISACVSRMLRSFKMHPLKGSASPLTAKQNCTLTKKREFFYNVALKTVARPLKPLHFTGPPPTPVGGHCSNMDVWNAGYLTWITWKQLLWNE